MTTDPNSLRVEVGNLKIETQSRPNGEMDYIITLDGVKVVIPPDSFKDLWRKAENCKDFKRENIINNIISLMSCNNDNKLIEDRSRTQ